ncbi:hypothetical protein BIW11_03253 [Tropilaelaps mercedesae]|uniref:Uncharacterized protein n=1 Tax=Tropilaelaps mercedesae TaxID=418985 RepID=A0A1V9XPR1_9ACAR|nr:hypothetical protein BIW11_03253 [Tropilaelaps mercedesae]
MAIGFLLASFATFGMVVSPYRAISLKMARHIGHSTCLCRLSRL